MAQESSLRLAELTPVILLGKTACTGSGVGILRTQNRHHALEACSFPSVRRTHLLSLGVGLGKLIALIRGG